MYLRLKVAQREIQLLHRIERHIGADIARAVAVSTRRTDEGLGGLGLFHLVDDVRLGRDDERIALHRLRILQDTAGAADIVRMVDNMRRAFGMRRHWNAGMLRLQFQQFSF